MTIRTIKTNPEEAEKIHDGKVSFIFRDERECFNKGDVIEFRVIKNGRSVISKLDSQAFVITEVMGCMQAPVNKGYQVIGFRRV